LSSPIQDAVWDHSIQEVRSAAGPWCCFVDGGCFPEAGLREPRNIWRKGHSACYKAWDVRLHQNAWMNEVWRVRAAWVHSLLCGGQAGRCGVGDVW